MTAKKNPTELAAYHRYVADQHIRRAVIAADPKLAALVKVEKAIERIDAFPDLLFAVSEAINGAVSEAIKKMENKS